MMKRVCLIIALLMIVLSIVSCSNQEDASSTSPIYCQVTLSVPNDATIDGSVHQVEWGKSYIFPVPKRLNFEFAGWQYGEEILRPYGIWTGSDNTTITAVWACKKYIVDGFLVEIRDDHAVIVGYIGDVGLETLTIPSEILGEDNKTYTITTIGDSAFKDMGIFTEMLMIPGTITIIEDNAISGCTGLPIKILVDDPQLWHANATIGANNGGLTK